MLRAGPEDHGVGRDGGSQIRGASRPCVHPRDRLSKRGAGSSKQRGFDAARRDATALVVRAWRLGRSAHPAREAAAPPERRVLVPG